MDSAPRLKDAARYIEGIVFVLRKGRGNRIFVEQAYGSLGPVSFIEPSLNQSAFEAALASMPEIKRNAFLEKMQEFFRLRGSIDHFMEITLGAVTMNVEIRGEVTQGAAGVFMSGYVRDCTETERLGAKRKSEVALSAAVRLFPDMVWLKDENGRYVLCNDMFDRFNRVGSGELIGKTSRATEQGGRAPIHDRTDLEAFHSNDIVTFEHAVPGGNGETRFFDVRKLALRDDQGKPIAILGTARETTEWRRLVNELKQSELAYRSLADNIPDRLIRFGGDGAYLHTNRPMREFFSAIDYPGPEQLMSGDPKALTNGLAACEVIAAVNSVLETGKSATRELEFVDRNSATSVHEIRFFPEFGPDGAVDSVLGIGRDVTERMEMARRLARSEAELHALAFRDSLTGLHNRRSFQMVLGTVLDEAHRSKSLSALLLLDIDRFKYVNDTLGHAVGDELIMQFGQRLVRAVGEEGYVSRLGGDEFAIIMPVLAQEAEAWTVAERVHQALATPVSVSVDSIAITTSIGIAFGLGQSSDQNELFRFADMALYAAKSEGRARTAIYDKGMAAQAERRFELETLINEGLRNNEFTAYFQTKIDLVTGEINGVEALCRWIRPDGKSFSPAEFIPMAEETGQIIEIGRRVLVDACRLAVSINADRQTPIPVSVNVSARQLLFGGFLGTLGASLEETGCAASWLELELTESLLLGEDSNTSETLDAIVKLGVSLTVDDFGTGYSSLSYIARFPITTLKIDQSFVRDLESNSKNAVLCRAIISMAQGLGLRTVAEGIETHDVAARLRALGCKTGQGFLWSRPEAAETVVAALRRQTTGSACEAVTG